MTLEQLLPELAGLSRDEKWRVVETLTRELTGRDEVPGIEPHRSYEVWSPLQADEAAGLLLRLLDQGEMS